jgi:hypothetical protein
MPDVVRILASGSSSPMDFTLHDDGHSERVAQWMARLAPADVLRVLSEYELALLLLAAYLHDIGMTPAVEKVRRHREFLLSGRAGLLTDDEAARFQYWLDSAGYGVTPPLGGSLAVDEIVRLADEIITYYTRHRHNDWSEEWIRTHLTGEVLGTYEGWVADLVRLCRSHHEGYEVLAGRDFDPRRVGAQAQVVHLRYLAALLRIADILDVDRERTPEVIFHHREVTPGSAKYWKKDAQLTVYLADGQLSIAARPPRAYLHRAVEETIDAIERELALCRRLADTVRFEKPVGPGSDLPHCWTLQPTVFRDVEPRDGAYQYIDGAFRPNTRRLLDLLSGTALYGDPLAAVRELLQNAFDAVRELVAYRRLQQPDPSDPALEAQLGKLLLVRLSLEQDGDRLWLVCRDTGIGMTQEIIRDNLLVSGSPIRPQVMELERRCRTAGFALGRTGQFGIGALSYFMLADQVVLTTRRANDAGDTEPNGWWFESRGIGSFGELRKDFSLANGTEIRMRLRSELAESPAAWAERLSSYVRAVLVKIPCNLAFDAPATPEASFRFAFGWTLEETERGALALERLQPSGEETGYVAPATPSPAYLHRIRRHAARWSRIRQHAERGLRWATEAGDLPNGVGRYRLHLPYLTLPGGVALAVVRPYEDVGGLVLRPVAEGHYMPFSAFTRWAWKGIEIEVTTPRSPEAQSIAGPFGFLVPVHALLGKTEPISGAWLSYGVSAEVDFQSPAVGALSVSRGRLDLTSDGIAAVDWLGDRARDMVETFVSEHRESSFTLMNSRISGVRVPANARYEWALGLGGRALLRKHERRRAVRWGQLRFPLSGVTREPVPLSWSGQTLSGAVQLRQHGHTWSGLSIAWHGPDTPPQRVVALENLGYGPIPVPLWTEPPLPVDPTFPAGWKSDFPPEWRDVCGAMLGGRWAETLAWNLGNPVVRTALASMSPVWTPRPPQVGAATWLDAMLEEILGNQTTAATWVLEVLSSPEPDLRDTLESAPPTFLPRLFEALFGSQRDAAGQWHRIVFYRATESPKLVVLSPPGMQIVESTGLPSPAGAEWRAT